MIKKKMEKEKKIVEKLTIKKRNDNRNKKKILQLEEFKVKKIKNNEENYKK